MLVSVIICTHRIERYNDFIEAVDSLISQSYDNIEIICIVDGNKDYYEIIKKKKGDQFKKHEIKLLLNSKNLGLLESRNRGVSLATGDIVAFIDDDAIADKDWIKELVKMYKRGAIAAGGKLVPLWVAKRPRWIPEEFYWLIGATHLGFPEEVTVVRNTFGSNLSFKREVFLELGGFNTRMGGIKGRKMLQGGETELCERMRKKYGKGVMYNPNAIVYHKIFKRRTEIGFLVRRAFWQGYSKALMKKLVGGIDVETSFLRYLLIDRTLDRLKSIVKGSADDLSKLMVIWLLTFFVGVGYIYGKIVTQD